jgi:hypothetical protein
MGVLAEDPDEQRSFSAPNIYDGAHVREVVHFGNARRVSSGALTATVVGAHLMAVSLLGSLLDGAERTVQPSRPPVAEQPHLWSELAGYYAPKPGFLTNFRSWETIGGEAQVRVRNRRLMVRALSPIPELRRGVELYPTDDADPLVFGANVHGLEIPIAFGRDDAGDIARLSVGGPVMMTLHRRSAVRSSRNHLRPLAAGGLVAAFAVRRRRHR